jgi:hypothetical protein
MAFFQVKNLGEGLSLEDRLLKRCYLSFLAVKHAFFVIAIFVMRSVIAGKKKPSSNERY